LFKHAAVFWNCSVLYTAELAYTPPMPRKLVWIEKLDFLGFGCSECNWVFNPSNALVGESLDAMKQNFEARRDKEFVVHVCSGHQSVMRPKTE
jgi:hypothetical protein